MRSVAVACVLLASALWAQQEPPSAPATDSRAHQAKAASDDDQQSPPSTGANVAPKTPVITIKGLCSSVVESAPGNCETQISRADFERLVDAILPSHQQAKVRQLASSYPDLLALSQEADARGLDKDPRVQARLAFARLQILSQELLRRLDEEAAKLPQNEIEDYYHSHPAEYETATFERIFVPLRKRLTSSPDEKITPKDLETRQQKSELEMTQVAEKLRTRATGGENFFTLQKDSYAAADMSDVPPNPSLGQLRRNGLPPGHDGAFDLKPGEVSWVITDSTGHYIYKLDTRQVEPFEKVKERIERSLKRERKEKAVQTIEQRITTTLNPDYFGTDPEAGKGKD